MFPRTAPFLAAGLALGIATNAGAQVVRLSEFDGRQSPRPHGRMSPPPAPGAFGGDIQQRMIPVAEFTPEQSGYSYENNFGSELRPTAAGLQRWIAPLGVPAGAVVEEILLLVEDEDDVLDVVGTLLFAAQAVDGAGDCDTGWIETSWNGNSAGIDGHGIVSMQGNVPYLVRSRAVYPPACSSENHLLYYIAVRLESTSHSLVGAIVRWRRSVSPAPLAATFNDVPLDHPFFQFVEALSASAITAGCGGGNFCPDNPVTRGQMAVFLGKALGLHWPQ